MAKIYETQDDYQRDKLAEQIHTLKGKSHSQAQAGWAFFVGSMLVDAFNWTRGRGNKLLTALSIGLMGGWGVQVYKSYKTEGKVRDLQLQKERLGPETVVLPPDMASPNAAQPAQADAHESCDECTRKKLAKPIHRRTVLEMAEKVQIGGDKQIH